MFGWDTVLLYLAVTALSVAASILLYKPPEVNPLEDPDKNNAGVRGTLAPLLLGHNKVTPILGYVGNRRTWQKKVGTIDGGLFHSDEDITQTQYRENGMHILCVGPARRLYEIREGGTVIFDIPLDAVSNPSGSQEFICTDEDKSRFRIYWGEQDQPIDSELASLTGINSRRPYCCYIHWTKKELGTSARWSNLEYVMDCATLGEESAFIDFAEDNYTFTAQFKTYEPVNPRYWWDVEGSKLFTTEVLGDNVSTGDTLAISTESLSLTVKTVYPDDGGYYIETAEPLDGILTPSASYSCEIVPVGTEAKGCNPALMIRQMLFYDFPHGLSLNTQLFDMTSLTDLIPYFADGGTEPAPATVYLKGGKSYKAGLAGIFQDYGILMYPSYSTGLYTFGLMRAGETPSVLSDDYIDLKGIKDIKAYSVLAADKMVYTFLESARNFTTSTILLDNDGKASLTGNPNARKVSLNTPTDIVTASAIAGRREQEAASDRSISLPVSMEKDSLEIGDVVTFEAFTGVWRLVGKGTKIDEASMDMSFMLDVYSIDNRYEQAVTSGIQVAGSAVPDVYVRAFDGNRYLNKDEPGYYLLRQPSAANIAGAQLYRSESDVTADYQPSQQLTAQVYGRLNEAIDQDEALTAIEITALGEDFSEFWEPELTDAQWRNGEALMLVGDELMSVKSITVIDSTTIQLNDILRGRFGTVPEAHSVDDDLGFFRKGDRPFITDENVLAGDTLYLRTQPYTTSDVLDLDLSSSETLNYSGGGFRPLTPENLNTVNDAYAWIGGSDADLRWDYKNATATTGAGFSLSDEPAELALPEGYFKITILNGSTVVREEFDILTNTFTYTQAMMSADFGSEPASFNIEVREVLNGLTSDADSATINKV